MSVPHPIPYQGSKRKLAPAILAFFPRDAQRLYEPFAGSAAVSIASAYFQKAQSFVIGDLNEPLIRLLETIVEHPVEIIRKYKSLWSEQQGHERRYYDQIRDCFNESHKQEHLLYLLARCVKASVRYNANGQFNQSPDNRRKGASPDTMARHIRATSLLLKGKSTFHVIDYADLLKDATPKDIIYMDPPYQGVCNQRDTRYLNGVSFDRFVETLSVLNDRQLSFIISYDGRTGDKVHGKLLPEHLGLKHIEIAAGRSSQETLLGRDALTYESLYLSPALTRRVSLTAPNVVSTDQHLYLFGEAR
jgi:DNA adenine methylase